MNSIVRVFVNAGPYFRERLQLTKSLYTLCNYYGWLISMHYPTSITQVILVSIKNHRMGTKL